MRQRIWAALILGLVAMPLLADSDNPVPAWPSWRGPLGNGHAVNANPPIQFDEKTNLKWKVPVPGKGSATPIVWGNSIFVVTAIASDRKPTPEQFPKVTRKVEQKTTPPNRLYEFVVLCYDRATGKERWRRTATEAVPHEGTHPTHSYAAGSPTTDGKRLYVSFGSRGIYAYSLDGELLWKRDLGLMTTRLGWGEAVTPVLAGDALLLNWDQEADSALYCLDAASGTTRWKADRPEKTSWNTPLVVTHDGVTQVILNGTTRVRSYDLANGKVLWSVGGMTTNAIPSPIVEDGTVFVMSGYRGAAAVAVSLAARGELTDAQLQWRYDRGTPYVPSPVYADGKLYFTQANTNQFTILDAKTGKVIVDRERLPGNSTFYASPAVAANRIYYPDREGNVYVLKVADSLEILRKNSLDETIDASPVIVGNQLILRGESSLYCFE
ncbi:outer membrane protein assembly factor BamB family protein [Tuwongella immobilis]|uniref:Pyrrolo-quinoline quinone repeat domain-containing protein n=1 Tax=Tuwongella immobilis TaxID=692036 RepID=A0A6C2YQE9_9BACT|nr:PQQ-binding-like beta-propeller repeat protein [Tuwongella immobilis]VIP03551.1 Uncharacterized protein OS=Blastopirellula marina DSM 3645 GN=DSM3645_20627 PE=4 SV=1: PQQ_2 [Tuwongella immobilis]VTS04470.1 Uncharacterized protein OS=Blastopirellula marina DSM 3645 GN=DSM3645_20627 PE=4 SV=1: PQQ_2 [Tuwongella immobilis]